VGGGDRGAVMPPLGGNVGCRRAESTNPAFNEQLMPASELVFSQQPQAWSPSAEEAEPACQEPPGICKHRLTPSRTSSCDSPFCGPYCPTISASMFEETGHRRSAHLSTSTDYRNWLVRFPASGAGGFTLLVSVQVSVSPGQMRTEGKGAQDISRSVIVK
jgi:hypothetical protein